MDTVTMDDHTMDSYTKEEYTMDIITMDETLFVICQSLDPINTWRYCDWWPDTRGGGAVRDHIWPRLYRERENYETFMSFDASKYFLQ